MFASSHSQAEALNPHVHAANLNAGSNMTLAACAGIPKRMSPMGIYPSGGSEPGNTAPEIRQDSSARNAPL